MRLWLLRPASEERNDKRSAPWNPWYDRAFGFVVRALDEQAARYLASLQAGDEKAEAWTDSALSTCIELLADGDEGVIIQDFAAA